MKRSLALLVLLPVIANAQNLSDKILVSPPTESNEKSIYKTRDSVLKVEDQTPNLLVVENKVEEDTSYMEDGLRVGVFGAPSYQSYKIDGFGKTGSFDAKTGVTYGLRANYSKINSSHAGFLNVDHSEVELKSPNSSIKPLSIDLKKDTAQLGYGYQGFFDGALSLNVGYEYVKQKSTVTTPSSLVSTFDAHGPVAGAGYLTYLGSSEIALKFDTLFFLPIDLKEDSTSSGVFKSGWGNYTSLMFSKKFNNHLIVAVGARVSMELYSFKGTPLQGTREAEFKHKSYSVPVEMKYQF